MAADVDGDGHMDLFFSSIGSSASSGTSTILLGDGKGGFSRLAVLPVASSAVFFADTDLDGRRDILLGDSGLILRNQCFGPRSRRRGASH